MSKWARRNEEKQFSIMCRIKESIFDHMFFLISIFSANLHHSRTCHIWCKFLFLLSNMPSSSLKSIKISLIVSHFCTLYERRFLRDSNILQKSPIHCRYSWKRSSYKPCNISICSAHLSSIVSQSLESTLWKACIKEK